MHRLVHLMDFLTLFFSFSSDWVILWVLLHEWVCCWSSLLTFPFQWLYSLAPQFLFDSFYGFYLFVELLTCLCIVFLISFSCLSVFSGSWLSFFKIIILKFLSGHLQISLFFGGGSVTGVIFCTYCSFSFLYLLCSLKPPVPILTFDESSKLLQTLLAGFRREIPSPVCPAKDHGVLSDISYVFIHSTSFVSSW